MRNTTTYTFSKDDLLKMEANTYLADEAMLSRDPLYEILDFNHQREWNEAMRRDITEQLRGWDNE